MKIVLSQNDTKVAVQEYLEKRWAVTAPETCPKVKTVCVYNDSAGVCSFDIDLAPGIARLKDITPPAPRPTEPEIVFEETGRLGDPRKDVEHG